MAEYNAKISVTADLSAAERDLKTFEAKINRFAQGVDIGKKIGRSFTEAFVAPKQLKQLDRELATIASRADTVAKRFARVVEGIGTIGVSAKGISDIGHALEQLSVSAQTVAAGFNNANAATKLLVPGFRSTQEIANGLSKSIGLLEYKFHALVPNAEAITAALAAIGPQAGLAAGAIATIGTVMETVLKGRAKELESDVGAVLGKITDQTQQLLRTLESLAGPIGGTARQFQRLLRAGEERLANVSAYSDEARRAMSTILTAETRLTAELERQAALRREMQAFRFATVAERAGMQFTFGGQKALPMAGQTAFRGETVGGLGGGARAPISARAELLMGATGVRAARSQDAASTALRFAQAYKEIPFNQVKTLFEQQENLLEKERAARTLPPYQERGLKLLDNSVKLNESNLNIERALNGERARGARYLEKQTAEERRQIELGILGQRTNKLTGQRGPGFAFPTAGPVPLSMYGAGRKPSAGGGARGFNVGGIVSNAVIGGAFPLLFGQGGGAATGGAIGGAVGGLFGGAGGFAGSLLGTLLGQLAGQANQVKELAADIGFSAQQTQLLATAFKQAGTDFDKFQESVSRIQGLGLALEDQASAIQLASTLTEAYGGKIDKVTNAFTNALQTGKVTQATLNQLTSQSIPIQQALANKYNVSRDALLQMAKDGKISVQDLINTLVNLGNEGVKNVNKNVTVLDKLKTSVENLGKAFVSLGNAIVTALQPVLDWLGKRIADIVNIAANAISEVGRLIERVNQGPQAAARAALKRGELPFGTQGVGQIIGQKRLQSIIKQAGPGSFGFGVNQKKVIDLLLKQPEFADVKPTPTPALKPFAAPAQMAPSGSGATKSKSDKAANDAAREAERVAEVIRSQRLVSLEYKRQEEFGRKIAAAEIARDPILVRRLQGEQQLAEWGIKTAKLLENEKNTAAQLAIAKAQQAEQSLIRATTEQDIAKIEADRKAQFEEILTSLQQEVTLATIKDEKARKLQEIEYKILELKKQGLIKTTEQEQAYRNMLTTISNLNKEMTSQQKMEQELFEGIAGTFANTVTSAFDAAISGSENFGTALQNLGSQLLSTISQMLIMYGIAQALGALGGGKDNPEGILSFLARAFGYKAKDGAYFANGVSHFANGGIVNTPTLFKFANGGTTQTGLMGEAGPEAIMPLQRGPDGQLGVNAMGLREAMAGGTSGSSSPVLNMSFETTSIGGVEYVSRDQLELAMAETRRQAAKDGARRGMTMTLDKLQQSPQTRSRIGLR